MNRTGFDPAKNMDSVFAQSTSAETDFDLMFDQDDRLIDIVAGFNEAGEPLTGVDFETLHQDSYNDKPSDFKDELETNGDKQGASSPEGTKDSKDNTVAVGKSGESDASEFEKDADAEYQKEKLEPKQEGVYDLFGIFDEADESDTKEDVDECNDSADSSNDDAVKEAAIDLFFLEAEEGTALDKVKDEDAEARNSETCSCGKANCPICGKVEPPAVQKVDLDESAPESDQPDGEDVDDAIEEAAIDLFFLEAEEVKEGEVPEGDPADPEEDAVKEEADESEEPSDTQPDPVAQEPNNGDIDDAIEEAAIDLFFLEAESIDKDVKNEVNNDDGDVEDDYVSTVDKNKKKSGKLEYEYSDEELIDSLM